MPQTVALQRGTTSVSANNTSSVTLFTQSGGIATRVIVNSLSISFSPSLNSARDLYITVSLQNSGGHNTLLGAMFQNSYGNTSFQFAAGVNTTNAFTGAFINSASNPTNKFNNTSPILSGFGSSGIGNASASNVVVRYASTNAEGINIINCMNSNFYMGPSDSIQLKCQGWVGTAKGSFIYATANVGYSFTTITES